MTAEQVKALENEPEKGGMQISGAEIFREEENKPKVTAESDVFGKPKEPQTSENSPKNNSGSNGESKDEMKNGQQSNPRQSNQPTAKNIAGLGKEQISGGIDSVAETVRQFVENLRTGGDESGVITGLAANYGETVVKKVEEFSQYFEKRDWREIMRDTQNFARRNPAAFVGGAFLLGLIGARFLKSGASAHSKSDASQNADNN